MADCRRQEEEDVEQHWEVQVLVEEIQKLKGMVVKHGVAMPPTPSFAKERVMFLPHVQSHTCRGFEFNPRPAGKPIVGPTRTFVVI